MNVTDKVRTEVLVYNIGLRLLLNIKKGCKIQKKSNICDRTIQMLDYKSLIHQQNLVVLQWTILDSLQIKSSNQMAPCINLIFLSNASVYQLHPCFLTPALYNFVYIFGVYMGFSCIVSQRLNSNFVTTSFITILFGFQYF